MATSEPKALEKRHFHLDWKTFSVTSQAGSCCRNGSAATLPGAADGRRRPLGRACTRPDWQARGLLILVRGAASA